MAELMYRRKWMGEEVVQRTGEIRLCVGEQLRIAGTLVGARLAKAAVRVLIDNMAVAGKLHGHTSTSEVQHTEREAVIVRGPSIRHISKPCGGGITSTT